MEGEGEALFEAVSEQGLEGIVAKDAGSRYAQGRRSRSWLKVKVPRRAELVVVSYRRAPGSPGGLRSLILAWGQDGALTYAGQVSAGLDGPTREGLRERLDGIRRDVPAFLGGPGNPLRGAVYAEPRLVCEVRFRDVSA